MQAGHSTHPWGNGGCGRGQCGVWGCGWQRRALYVHGEWVQWQGGRLELFEARVALKGLSKRDTTLGAEVVAVEPAQTAKDGEEGISASSVHAVGAKGKGEWIRWQGSRQERIEGCVALEGLGERHASVGVKFVVLEAAQIEKGQVCSERVHAAWELKGMGGWV